MADWTPPPYPQLVAGKPWTDEKASAAFENVEALAEGAPDAPKVQGVALGNYYIASVNGTGTTESAIVLPDRVELLRLDVSGITATTSVVLQIALSTDGGSTYGGWEILQSMSAACNYMASHVLDVPSSTQKYVGLVTAGTVSFAGGGGITIPSGANAVKFRMSTAGGGTHTYRAHAYVIGGVA